ncbi:hypothetical protein [Streptomyces sp. NPDC059611]|uniref:hypothetical protein n=1 Tax=Streptomyces sp. NPDC059611 TaxID=3346884 RepID=UPI003693ABC0
MDNALVIAPDGSVSNTVLPSDAERWRAAIRELVGGGSDQGRYHAEVLLHVRGNGSQEPNLTAWALASIWRNLQLPYLLYGTVVVTGPAAGQELSANLAAEVQAAGSAVTAIMNEWRDRRPVSDDAAEAELLAGVRHSIASLA